MASEMSFEYGTTESSWNPNPNPQYHESYMPTSSHTLFTMPSTSMSRNTMLAKLDTPIPYSSSSTFVSTNNMPQTQHAATVSPLQTRFVPDESSPQSYDSPTSDFPKVSPSSKFEQGHPAAPSISSSEPSQESHHSPRRQRNAGRKRRSETAEVGTARAIYLEKNRKAASKCRSKQKREQETLVEEARNYERRNRMLKMEVEMLRGDLHDLMAIVGQHANCPDSRLLRYVQREADRLAAGGDLGPQVADFSKSSPEDREHGSSASMSPSMGS
jgi:cyclic AMP-dependent transcription factor ATF-2